MLFAFCHIKILFICATATVEFKLVLNVCNKPWDKSCSLWLILKYNTFQSRGEELQVVFTISMKLFKALWFAPLSVRLLVRSSKHTVSLAPPFVPGISSSRSSSPSRLLSAYMSALLGLPLSARHRASFWPFTGCVPMDKGRKLHWNEPENMLKHPSTKPAICNLLLGIVRHCSTRSYSALALSLFFLFCLPRVVFVTPHWVHLNVCHLWLGFTLVVLLEVGVSHLNSCHPPEEVQKMFTSLSLSYPSQWL